MMPITLFDLFKARRPRPHVYILLRLWSMDYEGGSTDHLLPKQYVSFHSFLVPISALHDSARIGL